MNQQLKDLAKELDQAYVKFDLVDTPQAQDAVWHEIQAIKCKIDLLRNQAS